MPEPKFAADWDLPIGGFLDDVDVTIQFCTFEFDAGYNDGKSLLAVMHFTRDDNGEVVTQGYSVGGDWLTPDGGLTIQSSKARLPSKQSNYGRFIEAAKAIPEMYEVVANRGPTTDSKVWEGLRVHLNAEERTYTIRGESEPRTSTITLPTVFNGVDTTSTGQQPSLGTTPVQPPPAAPSTPPVATGTPAMTPEEIVAAAKANQGAAPAADPALVALAKSSPDHATFLAAAVNGPNAKELMADDALMQHLMDGGPSGFFITHH